MKHLKFYFYAILQNNTENMKLQYNAEIKHTQKNRKYKIQYTYFKTEIEIQETQCLQCTSK